MFLGIMKSQKVAGYYLHEADLHDGTCSIIDLSQPDLGGDAQWR